MDQRDRLEIQIEQLRVKMYQMYEDSTGYDKLVEMSQQLDQLLNELKMFDSKK